MKQLKLIQDIRPVQKKQPETFFEKIRHESKQQVKRIRRYDSQAPLDMRAKKQLGIDTDNIVNNDPIDILVRFKSK